MCNCGSERIMSIQAHCSDMCIIHYGEQSLEGYVPHEINVGGGDDLEIDICLDCGQIQGWTPVTDEMFNEATERMNEF